MGFPEAFTGCDKAQMMGLAVPLEEMLVKTSTKTAPWCLVEGNDKYWARVKVLSELVKILSTELDYKPADPLKGKGKARQSTPRKT